MTFGFGFKDFDLRGLFDIYIYIHSITHTTINLVWFDCDITLEYVPGSNQWKSMSVKFLAQGNNGKL